MPTRHLSILESPSRETSSAANSTPAPTAKPRASRLPGVVGVVVNRVAAARETRCLLQHRLGDAARTFLVTGRMRPLDRNDPARSLSPLARSGRARDASAPALILVPTQCIEAGADPPPIRWTASLRSKRSHLSQQSPVRLMLAARPRRFSARR
jgi:hypothetical protein